MHLTFNTQQLEKYKDIEHAATLTPLQQQLMDLFCDTLHHHLPQLNKLVIRGMFRLAVKQWVKETELSCKDVMEFSEESALPHIQRVFSIVEEKLRKVLRDPQQTAELTDVIQDAATLMIEKRRILMSSE